MSGHSISRRRLLAGMGAATAFAAGGGGLLRRPAGAATTPLITVDPSLRLGRLGARALGFSFERSTLPLPLFDDANDDLVALFRLLGPGCLRVGAKTVDTTRWDPTGPGRTVGLVAPSDLGALARFATATDWDVLHGLPLVGPGSAPEAAAEEAAVVAAALGGHLGAYEFGNEPDLYGLDATAAPLAGTLDLFRTRWEAFAEALRGTDATTPLAAPGCCLLQTSGSYTTPFVEAEADRVGWITQHYYRGFGGASQTIDLLLSPDPLFASSLDALAALAGRMGARGVRLTETNSFASGGQPGVSNTFASALWAVGLLLDATAAGAQGCNFHNSGAGQGYPAIVQIGGTVTEVRPLYYGLLLLASLGTGTHLGVGANDIPPTLGVHALARDDGDLAVVVRNLDSSTPVSVDVDFGVPLARASIDRLEAPGLGVTTDVTFRGAPVAPNGSWSPAPSTDLAVSASTCTLTVPAASAVVLRATPMPVVPTTHPGSASSVTTSFPEPSSTQASSTGPSSTEPSATEPSSTEPSSTVASTAADARDAIAGAPAIPVRATPTYIG